MKNSVLEITQDDIIRHEGNVNYIYEDSLGLKTFGIGHLVTRDDPEFNWPVGTPVNTMRILSAFEDDFMDAVDTANKLVPHLEAHPEKVQRVIINMAFNLGFNKLSKFKKMLSAIRKCDYATAAEEMLHSRWHDQVGNRSMELRRLMLEVADMEAPKNES